MGWGEAWKKAKRGVTAVASGGLSEATRAAGADKVTNVLEAGSTGSPDEFKEVGEDIKDIYQEGSRKPEQQYYGGSPEAYKEAQDRYKAGSASGAKVADRAVNDARAAANRAGDAYGELSKDWMKYGQTQNSNAQAADRGFNASMGDYQEGRDGVLRNAGRIEADAAGLSRTYQQTADKAFQLNQNRAARAAMAQGARGGASGLRQAIASQTMAGADASAQAEMIRAQEFNQLAEAKRNAYATAAGIRSGVGAQDQNAGSIYGARAQNSYANAAAANAARTGIVGARYDAASDAARIGADVGAAREAGYLGAEVEAEIAQLNAEREREQARQEQMRWEYKRAIDPFGVNGGL